MKLLHSGHLSDLEFEIITSPANGNGNGNVCSITNTNEYHQEYNEEKTDNTKKEYHIFKAHRVIVAARFIFSPSQLPSLVFNWDFFELPDVNGLKRRYYQGCRRILIEK